MSPQRFETNQAVASTNMGAWHAWENPHLPDPKNGEVYHVTGYLSRHGRWWISLRELPPDCFYDEGDFEPVISTEELEEALISVPEEQTA